MPFLQDTATFSAKKFNELLTVALRNREPSVLYNKVFAARSERKFGSRDFASARYIQVFYRFAGWRAISRRWRINSRYCINTPKVRSDKNSLYPRIKAECTDKSISSIYKRIPSAADKQMIIKQK